MAPRAERPDETLREIAISNVPNRGLGYYDRNSKLILVSDVNLKLIGT
jgi:hypothetical protein